MSEPLQLIIRADGLTICHAEVSRERTIEFDPGVSLGQKVAELCITYGITGNEVNLFIAEELLFYKSFTLPANTQDLKEAISYQLGMLVPFEEEDLLYSFSSVHRKDVFRITLVAASRKKIEPYLAALVEAGIRILGLFPEFQRYITKAVPKDKWVAVLPGRTTRALVFQGSHLEERLLFPIEPSRDELVDLCACQMMYHCQPNAGSAFVDARQLLSQKGYLKDFNMLPENYRRPEFSRFIIIALLVLNIIALFGYVGGREYQMRAFAAQVEAEIEELKPQVKELRTLHDQETELAAWLKEVEGVGANPDIIGFLQGLTAALPKTAYLDQMRLDGKLRAVQIQGYTEDVGELTGQLQELGDAKLKSTSRRKNQIYFNVEIPLP